MKTGEISLAQRRKGFLINMANVDEIIEHILKVAAQKRESAGYAGEMGDGGARDLEDEVKFYKYGVSGTFPPEWERYQLDLDPERLEYLRLKKKFEGK